jgi:hypothetical protein
MSRVLAAILTVGLMAGAAFAQGNISGAWDLNVNGPEGPIAVTATFKQDGEKLTGAIETPQGKADFTGTLKGKAMNISFQIAGPNGALDVKVNGDVDGASMKGIVDFGMGMADFTGKKK